MDKLYAPYRKFAKSSEAAGEGIVVGSDLTQQWLLPWWWEHYRRFNTYPVTFVDFGMTEEMKQWCRERGHFVSLPVADIFVAEKKEVDSSLSEQWEGIYGTRFWPSRNAWFKKPAACLQSPYRLSIWIDLDCEIRGSLKELFDLCETGSGIALAKEDHESTPHQIGYNSGVIVFKQGISLIESWADGAFDSNESFAGDQDILSKIIHDQKWTVTVLPSIYNWSRCSVENPQAVILHWHGLYGKSYIHHQILRARLEEDRLGSVP